MKMKLVILGVNNPRCWTCGGNGHIGEYCKNGKSNNDSNNNNNDSNNNNRQYNYRGRGHFPGIRVKGHLELYPMSSFIDIKNQANGRNPFVVLVTQ